MQDAGAKLLRGVSRWVTVVGWVEEGYTSTSYDYDYDISSRSEIEVAWAELGDAPMDTIGEVLAADLRFVMASVLSASTMLAGRYWWGWCLPKRIVPIPNDPAANGGWPAAATVVPAETGDSERSRHDWHRRVGDLAGEMGGVGNLAAFVSWLETRQRLESLLVPQVPLSDPPPWLPSREPSRSQAIELARARPPRLDAVRSVLEADLRYVRSSTVLGQPLATGDRWWHWCIPNVAEHLIDEARASGLLRRS